MFIYIFIYIHKNGQALLREYLNIPIPSSCKIMQYRLLDTEEGANQNRSQEDVSVLIVTYYSEANFYKLYDVEVIAHPLLGVVPPRWCYWRALRSRCSWSTIVAFYLLFVLVWTSLAAIASTSVANKPSIYSLQGFGCGDSGFKGNTTQNFNIYSVNGSFNYYIQGFIGVCNVEDAQQYNSPSCIGWSDSKFWENFQTSIKTDDYVNVYDCSNCVGQAESDASDNSERPSDKYFYYASVATALSRPLEAIFSFLTRKYRLRCLKNNFGYFLRSLIIFCISFLTFYFNAVLGMVGDEDVDACIQVTT